MTTAIAPDFKPDHAESEKRPALRAVPAAATREHPNSESFDPAQGRKIGAHPSDDPTQGRQLGSDPYDDPTRAG